MSIAYCSRVNKRYEMLRESLYETYLLRKYLGADKLTLRRGVKKFLDANIVGNGLQKLKKLKELDVQLQIKQFDIGCLCGDIVANDCAVMDEYAENHCTTLTEVHVPMLHSNNRNEAACTEGWHEQSTENEEQELTAYQVVDVGDVGRNERSQLTVRLRGVCLHTDRGEVVENHSYARGYTPHTAQLGVDCSSATACGKFDMKGAHDLPVPVARTRTGRNVPMVAYGGARPTPAESRDVNKYHIAHDVKSVEHHASGPQCIACHMLQFAYESSERHIAASHISV